MSKNENMRQVVYTAYTYKKGVLINENKKLNFYFCLVFKSNKSLRGYI